MREIRRMDFRRVGCRILVTPRWGFWVCGAWPITQGCARGLMNHAPSVLSEGRGDLRRDGAVRVSVRRPSVAFRSREKSAFSRERKTTMVLIAAAGDVPREARLAREMIQSAARASHFQSELDGGGAGVRIGPRVPCSFPPSALSHPKDNCPAR